MKVSMIVWKEMFTYLKFLLGCNVIFLVVTDVSIIEKKKPIIVPYV